MLISDDSQICYYKYNDRASTLFIMSFYKTRSKNLGTILIVEDNIFMAELFAEKISNIGYGAVSVYDGKEALEKISKEKPVLILLDLPLSGEVNGFELLTKVRNSYDKVQLPVVVLFNATDPTAIERSLKLGANYYLIKAYANTEEIITKIGDVLKSKTREIPIEKLPAVSKADVFKEAIKLTKKSTVKASQEINIEAPKRLKEKIDNMLTMPEGEISIINLVDGMMEYAFLARASDIHLDPYEDKLNVRYRIDGVLHEIFTIPKEIHLEIIARIKVLSGLRTDEHQAAQDGRFRISTQNEKRMVDVRVSIAPTYYGENGVLRLLAEQGEAFTLDHLGFNDRDLHKLKRAITKPYGMILATGPTGSGKTTTLYGVIKELNKPEVSIITIEDPIEYSISGIDQLQVNARTGLTFAGGLRSILRQDPNVIMVGEIRDEETAGIAVNAALTGHLLLSTLHTNDAPTALPRLIDMKIEPFLIASTVNIVLGQRLVRKICPECKITKKLTAEELKSLLDVAPEKLISGHQDFSYGKGCVACDQSGYRGRIGIYEVMEIDEEIRAAIVRRADASEIKKIAVKNGMTTMVEDGFQKILSEITTIEEILRVIHE